MEVGRLEARVGGVEATEPGQEEGAERQEEGVRRAEWRLEQEPGKADWVDWGPED